MNLLPLAALLIACLALAVSVVTLITVHRRPRAPRRGTDTLSRQAPASRIPYADEVGPDFRGQVRSRNAPEPRIMPASRLYSADSDIANAAAERILKNGRHL